MAIKPKIHCKDRMPFVRDTHRRLGYGHSSIKYTLSFKVMQSDPHHHKSKVMRRSKCLNTSPRDNVPKGGRTINSGRMKT
jgi:hypothetical protein